MKIILCLFMLMFFACDNEDGMDFGENDIVSIDYGVGAPCGGSVMNFNGSVYRTYNGGAAPIVASNLTIMDWEKLGDYNDVIYHAETINGNLWFSVVTYDNVDDFVKVVNSSGEELASYEVGLYPGDFASWGDYVFVSNEGGFGSSNGSISMIDESTQSVVAEYENIGDVVQSIEVYNDKLIVLINNSHKIKIFNIDSNGLQLPGVEVDTGDSSPREMAVFDNKVYFTNWNTKDVKVFNLYTYQIENSVSMPLGLPEDIVVNNQSLYVTIPNLEMYDQNLGSEVVKISISDLSIEQVYDVGLGPEFLTFSDDGSLYISRKNYSQDWYTTYHGTSKIIMP